MAEILDDLYGIAFLLFTIPTLILFEIIGVMVGIGAKIVDKRK